MNLILLGVVILTFMFLGSAAFPEAGDSSDGGKALPAFLGILVFFISAMIGGLTDNLLVCLLLGLGFLIYRAVTSKKRPH